MDFDKLIREIQAHGLSERTIGREIGISQSSIRNMRDNGGQPKWQTGQALIELHSLITEQAA